MQYRNPLPDIVVNLPVPDYLAFEELRPLPDTLPAVKPFDLALLPEAFRDWIGDIAERMQCPSDFPAVASMICLASLIGRQCAIRPKAKDDWTVTPNLWGGVIGRPSLLKSPAIAEPKSLIDALEAQAREEYEEAKYHYAAEMLVAEEKTKACKREVALAIKNNADAYRFAAQAVEDANIPEPVRRRYITADGTVERIGELLRDNQRGILIFRDELNGLLASLDKDGQEGSRAFYLEAWNGNGRFTFDRVGRGTVEIEAATLSILGSIQPGPLQDYLRAMHKGGAGDDGLLQRFQLIVWPDSDKKWRNVDRFPDSQAKARAREVFTRLDALDPKAIGASQEEGDSVPWLRFNPDAQASFNEWRTYLENRIRSADIAPALEAHLAKYRSLVPSLALICHLADYPQGGPVGLDSLTRAIAWAEYLETHARRVYAQSLDPAMAAAKVLAARLDKLPNPFRARDVDKKDWSGLNKDTIPAALEILEDYGFIIGRESPPVSGRPTRDYFKNPAIPRGKQ
jgi:putative DNA primase/helicase